MYHHCTPCHSKWYSRSTIRRDYLLHSHLPNEGGSLDSIVGHKIPNRTHPTDSSLKVVHVLNRVHKTTKTTQPSACVSVCTRAMKTKLQRPVFVIVLSWDNNYYYLSCIVVVVLECQSTKHTKKKQNVPRFVNVTNDKGMDPVRRGLSLSHKICNCSNRPNSVGIVPDH